MQKQQLIRLIEGRIEVFASYKPSMTMTMEDVVNLLGQVKKDAEKLDEGTKVSFGDTGLVAAIGELVKKFDAAKLKEVGEEFTNRLDAAYVGELPSLTIQEVMAGVKVQHNGIAIDKVSIVKAYREKHKVASLFKAKTVVEDFLVKWKAQIEDQIFKLWGERITLVV